MSNTGTTTATYYTLWEGGNAGVFKQQSIFNGGGVTTAEIICWAAILTVNATTGNFAGTTLVSPTFPLVGAIGNPGTGLMIYRNLDFADNVQLNVTLYNTAHNYLTAQYANVNTTSVGVAASVMIRFE